MIAEQSYDDSILAITKAVVTSVLKIALLVCVGIRLEMTGVLNGQKRKCLSALAMDVCLPCLMFSDVLPEADATLLSEGWQLLLWPLIYSPVSALLGALCCLLVGIPAQHLGSAAACAAFPNVNGFPVAIISALGPTVPKSPTNHFSPMVFLSLLQLTDGVVKYSVGPAIFRRDLRAVRRCHLKALRGDEDGHMPLGASLRSLQPPSPDFCDLDADTEQKDGHQEGPCLADTDVTEFGLQVRQVRIVEPEWSRFESYQIFSPSRARSLAALKDLDQPLLDEARQKKPKLTRKDVTDLLRQLFPPQVIAVMLAIAIGVAPPFVKGLLLDKENKEAVPLLGFVYGTAKALGAGFVPLQMIALGGRLVNIASDSGPLAAKGEAGPRGRSKLLRISGAVGVARMILAPIVLYGVALLVNEVLKSYGGERPLAFWVPALVVVAMPTANNMSTMADLVGSGRSISAASTAMQLLVSPVVLAISLSLLLAGAAQTLAADIQPALA